MKKKIFIAGAILIAITTGVYFYLKSKRLTDFEPLIKEKIQQLVKEGSKGLYHIEIGKIDVDILQSKLSFSDIHLTYDTSVNIQLASVQQQPADLFDVSIKSISIDGLTPLDVLKKKDIRLNVLYINNPVIKLYHTPGKTVVKDSSTLYSRITKQIGSFGIKQFVIKNADVSYLNTKTHAEDRFPELHISMDDLLIDESTQYDSSRFLYSKDVGISLVKYSRRTADSIYSLSLDSVFIQASKKEVNIKKLQVKPLVSKAEFRKIVKKRKDRYDVSFNDVKISNINWWGVVTNEAISIGDVLLSNGSVEIYSDKTIPASSEPSDSNYPHHALFKTDVPITIDRIKIKNLDFNYGEFNEESLKEGRINFQNTDALITNVTNIPAKIEANPLLKIDATTRFMKAADLKAGFTFNLAKQKQGIFSVYANLGPIDGKLLNPITEPLSMVKVNEAEITGYKVTMNGSNSNATAKVLLTYKNLNVSLLKKDDDGKLKKKGVLSFIANNFKLNGDSPKKGKPPVTYTGFFVRQKDEAFFYLVWKTMLEGIKKTAGI